MRSARPLTVMMLFVAQSLAAQTRELPPGFQRVAGRYVDIITDMPLSDDLRSLPAVFDAAMPIWCSTFSMKLPGVVDWHCEAFIMLDRKRFADAGFIPNHLPDFPFGFQFENQLWVTEQPSAYYRRHLLLHEGTHWFMNRKFGGNGPPWLMEGMAEWLGTHSWDVATQTLKMGIIPKRREDVPYWGRVSLIQSQLNDGIAPSLETVLRYGNTAHQHVEAYAWSWAAVLFLQNHPETKSVWKAMFRRPMRSDRSMTRWLFSRLRPSWPRIRQQWNAMLTELEYGFDPTRGMLTLLEEESAANSTLQKIVVHANQSWQPSGVFVAPGEKVTIKASGEFVVRKTTENWRCEPDGVTLEYYRGNPLGRLMMTVVAPIPKEPDFSLPLRMQSVGSAAEITIQRGGELQFRVNEASRQLADNVGQIAVSIAR